MVNYFGIFIILLICGSQLALCDDDDDYDVSFLEETTKAKVSSKVSSTTQRSIITTEKIKTILNEAQLDEEIEILFRTSSNGCDGSEKCVSFFLCTNGTTKTDGAFLINPRFGGEVNPCPPLKMCCKKPNYVHPNRSEPLKSVTSESTYSASKGCGIYNKNGVGEKVIGRDNETQFGEFPWMVAVLETQKTSENVLNVYQSGGSLIHKQVVLTTAHNIVNLNIKQIIVRAGEWETQSENEILPHQERSVKKLVSHEEFDNNNLHNDVALLFLVKAFELDRHINIVCLPPPKTKFDDSLCISTGWGKKTFGKKSEYSVFLKKIQLPVVKHEECEKLMQETRLGEDFLLDKGFLCAGGQKNVDMCKGDGGSPLICPIDGHENHFYQIGVVSWGISCGEDGIPGIYVDVSQYRDWIDEKVEDNGFESSEYNFDAVLNSRNLK